MPSEFLELYRLRFGCCENAENVPLASCTKPKQTMFSQEKRFVNGLVFRFDVISGVESLPGVIQCCDWWIPMV